MDLPSLEDDWDLPPLDGIDGSRKPAAYSESPSSNTSVCTPKRELDIVRAFAPIGLDPCGHPASAVCASTEWYGCDVTVFLDADGFSIGDAIYPENQKDGLKESWSAVLSDSEIAFVNPPYGRYIVPWIDKMNREAKDGVEIIGLLPGRFDTRWFRALDPDRICWYGRRVAFIDPMTPERRDCAKFPSIFAYWGEQVDRFAQVFGEHGVVTRWRR